MTTTRLEMPGGVLVAVRGGRPRDVRAAAAQLFAVPTAAARDPELVLVFDDDVARAEVDWPSLATERWHLRAPASRRRVRFLGELSRLRLLVRGALPLHAAAAERGGGAWVIAGAAGGGKTELLLGLLEAGCAFVGGEWVCVQGGRVESMGDALDLRAHHLAGRTDLRRRLGMTGRLRYWLATAGGIGRLDRLEMTSGSLGVRRTPPGSKLLIRALVWTRRRDGEGQTSVGRLRDVVDAMARAEASRYSSLLAHHQRAVDAGMAPLAVITGLRELIAERIGVHLAGVPVLVAEHDGSMPADRLLALAEAVS